MAKVKLETHDGITYCIYDCPCGDKQWIPITGEEPIWQFNNDVNNPTLSPSIRTTWGPKENPTKHLCHVFMKEGKIQFLTDCTHEYAGQTIELSEI